MRYSALRAVAGKVRFAHRGNPRFPRTPPGITFTYSALRACTGKVRFAHRGNLRFPRTPSLPGASRMRGEPAVPPATPSLRSVKRKPPPG